MPAGTKKTYVYLFNQLEEVKSALREMGLHVIEAEPLEQERGRDEDLEGLLGAAREILVKRATVVRPSRATHGPTRLMEQVANAGPAVFEQSLFRRIRPGLGVFRMFEKSFRRIRDMLTLDPVVVEGASLPVEVTIGGATSRSEGVEILEDLFKVAESALGDARQSAAQFKVALECRV